MPPAVGGSHSGIFCFLLGAFLFHFGDMLSFQSNRSILIMVGFGSLWTFSSGFYCFFFTLHFSVPEISLYIKSACLLPPTYKFCTYYGTKSVLSACRFFVIFTRICNFCNVFRRFLAVISFTRLCNSAVWNDFPQYGKRNALQVPASGTKIVLNALSYFCQPLQWYPILKNVTLIMT